MLKEYAFRHVYLRCGYTDIRKGIDGLAEFIRTDLSLDPFAEDTLYLFCGRKADRIKGLVYEKDGFLLLYKRVADGHFKWPRTPEDVKSLAPEQFRLLMDGFSIEKSIRLFTPKQL